jgi:hypothetical protein
LYVDPPQVFKFAHRVTRFNTFAYALLVMVGLPNESAQMHEFGVRMT